MDFKLLKSALVKNSAWGIGANILQTIFVSSFFIIVARNYPPSEFAQFLIATTVYQLMAAFSSMGLGQWFIRQYESEADKVSFTSRFLKIQVGLGLFFYLVSIGFAWAVYPEAHIRLLCIVLGTNIIFDNFINAIKSLNIAEFRQQKTAVILVIDGFLKLLVGCLLFLSPFSSLVLSALMIVVRILTLSLFIKVGSSNSINFNLLWKAYISLADIKAIVLENWQFIVISSISIIYWRIGNIIISKLLTLADVANYEIASAIFSIVSILPVIVSVTVYPQFIRYFKEENYSELRKLYKNVFLIYSLFAIISYAFMYSFSGVIIPLAFGKAYPGAILCAKEMFLTFLVLPTVLLQANLIVSMHLEKLDMWFNVASLLINVVCCVVGLYFVKSLSVINYSILISFVVFHFLQDVILVRRKFTSLAFCGGFYVGMFVFVVAYQYISDKSNPYLIFTAFAIALFAIGFLIVRKTNFSVHEATSAGILKET